ncbi:MAG TPA: sialate O-acetylesterase, partial [Urbifossiella sp.]
VKPHPIFADNMVLQQGVALNVWGQAEPGEQVQVMLNQISGNDSSSSVGGVAADKDGKWLVKLPARKAGTGYTLAIKGKNAIEFKNVAVGEVWICSGQSNMQWEFWRQNLGDQGKKVAAMAKNPNLRLITLKRRPAAFPQDEFPVVTEPREGTKGVDTPKVNWGKWETDSPEAVIEFSAVAYYFGRKLESELKVPVGLIATSWGGTVCEAWTSLEALDAEPSLKPYANAARAAAKNFEEKKIVPGPNSPTALYNGMIHPLLKFPVKGAIWYQGESNAPRAFEYRTLYPTMIKDWRARWNSDLTFIGVQLAPFWDGDSNGVRYAELRDAQLHATKVLKNVGIAVIVDVGNEKDIHPPRKEPVGIRLALNALALAYGKKIEFSGPIFKSLKIEGDKAIVSFDHAEGLASRDESLPGFTIAGEDNVFVPAKAEIKGSSVVVSSDKVRKPAAVRYGWVNFAKPTLSLFNVAGLPASPFRTDDLPLTTAPKK